MKSFRNLIEEIESVVEGTTAKRSRADELHEDWDSVNIYESHDDKWGPATSMILVATALEDLSKKIGEDKAIESLQAWINEAWSYAISPEERDVSADVGTIDEPPVGGVPRGFRGRASGLTPSAEQAMSAILAILSKNPPKPILEFPIEVSKEVWLDALGKALNNGIGVKWELDKPTGIHYPMPDYQVVYGIWKAMMEKLVGVRPAREMDVKMMHSLDKAAEEAGRDLQKKAENIGKDRAAQASAILRGRRGRDDLRK